MGGWVGDGVLYIIQPLWGSILQAETCQIFSLAEIQDGAESGNKGAVKWLLFLLIFIYFSGKIQVVDSKAQLTYASSIETKPSAGPYNHDPSSSMIDYTGNLILRVWV